MIEAFRQHLSVAWSRAVRSLHANRGLLLMFGKDVRAAIAMPVLPTPARVVVRAPVATRQTDRTSAR